VQSNVRASHAYLDHLIILHSFLATDVPYSGVTNEVDFEKYFPNVFQSQKNFFVCFIRVHVGNFKTNILSERLYGPQVDPQ
jgi:hypothetical protein